VRLCVCTGPLKVRREAPFQRAFQRFVSPQSGCPPLTRLAWDGARRSQAARLSGPPHLANGLCSRRPDRRRPCSLVLPFPNSPTTDSRSNRCLRATLFAPPPTLDKALSRASFSVGRHGRRKAPHANVQCSAPIRPRRGGLGFDDSRHRNRRTTLSELRFSSWRLAPSHGRHAELASAQSFLYAGIASLVAPSTAVINSPPCSTCESIAWAHSRATSPTNNTVHRTAVSPPAGSAADGFQPASPLQSPLALLRWKRTSRSLHGKPLCECRR